MKVKCDYCGNMINDDLDQCPHCGAPNPNVKRTVDKTPKTIEELKQWYADRHLPPQEVTRFFIGIDYKEPRAFGIYKDGGKFIVYKNKDDGSRAIRYSGEDEAYAVNELYLKLKSEILNQKARNQKKGGGSGKNNSGGGCLTVIGFIAAAGLAVGAAVSNLIPALIVIGAAVAGYLIINQILKKKGKEKQRKSLPFIMLVFLIIASIVVIFAAPTKSRARYFSYDGNVYAKYHSVYYLYDPYLFDYEPIDTYYVPSDILSNGDEYEFVQDGSEWDSSYMFEDSNYYESTIEPTERSSNSNDSDSDWDWDSGDSWDSGGSDWSSDW